MLSPAADDWRSGWRFLCPAPMLGADGDHLTVDLPDLSITVQNFRGTLAGFWNVCSHRSTQIRAAGRGCGMLRCPYHGWTYNRDGVPVGIPENAGMYGLDAEGRRALALKPVEIMARGAFVFFRVNAGTQALEVASVEDLGPQVAAVSRATATPPLTGRANFDLIIADGWTLLRWVLPAGGEGFVVSASLHHPHETAAAAAPPVLRDIFAAIAP